MATKRFAAWYSGKHPEHDIAVASYSDTMAEDMGADTSAILGSPQFKQVFPKYGLRRGGTAKSNIQTQAGGRMVFVGRGGALTGRGANCLVGETEVMTPYGARQIRHVRVGEEVLSYDERTGRSVWRRIEAVSARPQARIFRVSDNDGRVFDVTADHRVYAGGECIPTPGKTTARLRSIVRRTGTTSSKALDSPSTTTGRRSASRSTGAAGE